MAVLRPHSFKNMPRNRVQDYGGSSNRRNNNKLRMILEIMMILAFHILKVSIFKFVLYIYIAQISPHFHKYYLTFCTGTIYIYTYAESEVRLYIFSLISSSFLYDREGLLTLMKSWVRAGVVSRLCFKKNSREPLALNLRNPGYSAYDFHAKTEIS